MRNLMPDFTKENQYEFQCGVCGEHFLGRKGRCICDGCKPTDADKLLAAQLIRNSTLPD